MRFPLLFAWMFSSLVARAGERIDTVAYWVIQYDKTVIVQGNLNSPVTAPQQVIVRERLVKDLIVSFVYDSGQPSTSELVVKEKSEILRTLQGHPDLGPVFTVPVRELIGTHQPDVKYELDFYYTDDRGRKNLKLGTIVFVFK